MEDKNKPIAIDLFSGCGGLTLGLKQAGFTVVGAIEIESVAAETYRHNHPDVNLWEQDIKKVPGEEILATLGINKGELDLLAGCPPCQGFSSIRTFNGKKSVRDGRNNLVFEYLRLVKELMPKAVMMENVPALAKDHRMKTLVKELTALGYDCTGSPTVLNAADYGVPQRRRRMILACSRLGPVDLSEKKKDKRKTVWEAIGGMPSPGNSGDPLHDFPENRSAKVEKMISLIPKDGGSRSDLPKEYWLECHKRNPNGFKDVYGRMQWGDVSPTMTGGCVSPSKGRFLHPDQNRSITLREAALLQTFPRDYFFSLRKGKQPAALMIGNALPPEFIRRHALKIYKNLTNV